MAGYLLAVASVTSALGLSLVAEPFSFTYGHVVFISDTNVVYGIGSTTEYTARIVLRDQPQYLVLLETDPFTGTELAKNITHQNRSFAHHNDSVQRRLPKDFQPQMTISKAAPLGFWASNDGEDPTGRNIK